MGNLALLIVAALLARLNILAGLSPPAHVLKCSEAKWYLYVFINTLGLSASLSIIIHLTAQGYPFLRRLVVAAILPMMFAYSLWIPKKDTITDVLATVAFILPFLLRYLVED